MPILLFECQLKSSLANQDTLMEFDEMRFIFQHSLCWSPNTSVLQSLGFIGQKSPQQQLCYHHINFSDFELYSLKYIYIIIILSCHQHRYPWTSLATSPYHSSHPAGPQGYTLYPHRAAVCRFELVALLLLGHVKGSVGVPPLWARPFFSSSVLHVWFV